MLATYYSPNIVSNGIINETAAERRQPMTFESARVDQWQPGDIVRHGRTFDEKGRQLKVKKSLGIVVWAISRSFGHQDVGIFWSDEVVEEKPWDPQY